MYPCTFTEFSSESHTKHAQSVKRTQNHVHIISFFHFPFLSFHSFGFFIHSCTLLVKQFKKNWEEEEIGARNTMVIAFIHHSWCSLCCDRATSTHIARIQINLFKFFMASNYNSHNTTKYNTARAYHGNNFLRHYT